jgi:Arc/MetJ-type ribon-helix-helix transcriptional regulator
MPKTEAMTSLDVELAGFEDPDLAKLARTRHALNVAINEYDWNRMQEAARELGTASVSDVVRRALREWLDRQPESERFDRIARMALEFELEAQKVRSAPLGVSD